MLLVEHHADTEGKLRDKLAQTCHLLEEQKKLASGSYLGTDALDNEMLWDLAQRVVPTLYRLRGTSRPIPFIEDIAVPPEAMPDFLYRLQGTLNKHQITASVSGHAVQGQLHVRPFLDLANVNDVCKMETLAEEIYSHVWELKGTISGAHGAGLSRTPYLARQFGPMAEVFREVKELMDPVGIFNPGKIVPAQDRYVTDDLRHVSYPLLDTLAMTGQVELPEGKSPVARKTPVARKKANQPSGLVELQLDWKPEEMAHAARACNGCGICRTTEFDARMCPIFRFSPREEASPRAKANLARGILSGSLPAGTVFEDACKEIADLCVHCHMCRLECPANVDIPKLMIEAKASYLSTKGQGLHDWVLTRIDSLCGVASRISRVANWAISNRLARWFLQHLLGIAQGRKLPHFARQPFLQTAVKHHMNQPRLDPAHRDESVEKVLYFVDTYANYCDTELAESLVAVLEHNGISVYVPDNQLYAAMPMIAQGMLEPARKIAEHNVALLAEGVRQGYTIVATEPSAALTLVHEYPMLLEGDHDAQLVAAHTMEACYYLWRWHQQGQLRLDFEPLDYSVGYHAPCHQQALAVGTPAVNLLGLIPDLRIHPIEKAAAASQACTA